MGLTGIRLAGAIGGLLAVLAFFGWVIRIDHLRASWHTKYEVLDGQAQTVLKSVRAASDNPKLDWIHAAEQVDLIAADHLRLKLATAEQTDRINALGEESERLKALSAEARAKAKVAIAKRETVIHRLQTIAMTPGDRADCAAQLNDANNALDLAFSEGL